MCGIIMTPLTKLININLLNDRYYIISCKALSNKDEFTNMLVLVLL